MVPTYIVVYKTVQETAQQMPHTLKTLLKATVLKVFGIAVQTIILVRLYVMAVMYTKQILITIINNPDLNNTEWQAFTTGVHPRGNWATATDYAINDVVVYGGNTYIVLIGHTPGVFATDLGAGKWQNSIVVYAIWVLGQQAQTIPKMILLKTVLVHLFV